MPSSSNSADEMPTLVTLLDFNGIDGASPAGLTLDAKGDIFVVTGSGGVGGYGTLVELTPTGSGYNSTPDILLSFPSYGSNPLAPVVVDSNGNLIYGSQNGVFQLTKTSSGFAAQPTLVSQVSTLTQTSLVVDTSGSIYGTTSNGIFEIAQTTNGYNPTPIILGTTPGGLVGGPLFDSQGNIFALSTFSNYVGFYQVTEFAKTTTGYSTTSTPIPIAGVTAPIFIDQAGNIFTDINGGEVVELAKTVSGYAATPAVITFQMESNGDVLLEDARGDLFGEFPDGIGYNNGFVFELTKTATGYSSTPTVLYSFSGSDGMAVENTLVANASGDLFGLTTYGGSNYTGYDTGNGTIFELQNTGFQSLAILGSVSNQNVLSIGSIQPFMAVVINDINPNQTQTVTVTFSSTANGTLSNLGGGTYDASTGVYTDTGNSVAVSAALDGLIFTPNLGGATPGHVITTTFTITDTDTAGVTTSDNATTVATTYIGGLPTITGTVANQAVITPATITPFSLVTINDVNPNQTETVTVTSSDPANGALYNLGTGSYNATTRVYTVTGTAAAVTQTLDGLIFDPAVNATQAGQTVTTGFTINDTDTAGATASDSVTSVAATIAVVNPVITGVATSQSINDPGTISPFTSVAISDQNPFQTETVTIIVSTPGSGVLSNLSGGSYDAATGIYTATGTAMAVTAAVDGLVFTPTPYEVAVGQSVTTAFFLSDTDSLGLTSSESTSLIVATATASEALLVGVNANQTLSLLNEAQAYATAAAGQAALAIGVQSGVTGSVLVDAAGSSLTANGYGVVGEGGLGTLTVSDYGLVTIGNPDDTTPSPLLSGTYVGQTLAIGSGQHIGGGHGQLNVTSGGQVDVAGALIVGDDADAGGVSVDDGAVIDAGGQISIGNAQPGGAYGYGGITVGSGGTLEAGQTPSEVPSNTAGILLATGVAASYGFLNVTGAGALVTSQAGMAIGVAGTGVVDVSNAGVVQVGSLSANQPALTVGVNAGSNGTLIVENAGFQFTIDGYSELTARGLVEIGVSGTGNLFVQSDSAMTIASSAAGGSPGLILGLNSGSVGNATITDYRTNLINTGMFVVGDAGVGKLAIQYGATVTTSGATGDGADIGLASGSAGSSVTVFAGSQWTVAGSVEIGVGASGSLTVGDGGLVSATSVDVGAGASGTGTLSLSLTPGDGSTSTGLTVANTLNVGVKGTGMVFLGANTNISVDGAMNIGSNGTLTGNGTLNAAQITNNGTIAAANGTLTVTSVSYGTATALHGTGVLNVGSNSILMLNGAVNGQAGDAVTVAFTGPKATLDLADPAAFGAIIKGYAAGDTIGVAGLGVSTSARYSYQGSDTVLTFGTGTSIKLAGIFAYNSVHVTNY